MECVCAQLVHVNEGKWLLIKCGVCYNVHFPRSTRMDKIWPKSKVGTSAIIKELITQHTLH